MSNRLSPHFSYIDTVIILSAQRYPCRSLSNDPYRTWSSTAVVYTTGHVNYGSLYDTPTHFTTTGRRITMTSDPQISFDSRVECSSLSCPTPELSECLMAAFHVRIFLRGSDGKPRLSYPHQFPSLSQSSINSLVRGSISGLTVN